VCHAQRIEEEPLLISEGKVLYSGAQGVQSLAEGSTRPFQLDTICAIASMTKLKTSVAALQCVEAGLIALDDDVAKYLPTIGKYGIITGFVRVRKQEELKD
jgi:CubicO group peptidase (beta-lactamase class C family)